MQFTRQRKPKTDAVANLPAHINNGNSKIQVARQKKAKMDATIRFCFNIISNQHVIRVCLLIALVSSAWMNGYKSSQSYTQSLDHNSNRDHKDRHAALKNAMEMKRVHDRSIRKSNNQGDENIQPVLHYKSDATHSVHVVIAHCNMLLDWVWDSYLNGLTEVNKDGKVYSIKSVTILTKCGFPLKLKEIPLFKPHPSNSQEEAQLPPVNVLSLPNVGRCDHSYAYWIKSMLSPNDNDGKEHTVIYSNSDDDKDPFPKLAEIIDKSDLVLFMKDNDNKEKAGNSFFEAVEMFEEALYNDRGENPNDEKKILYDARRLVRGVGCGMLPGRSLTHTLWSHRSIMWQIVVHKYPKPGARDSFTFRSKYWPMGRWIQSFAFYSFPDYSDPNNLNYNASLPPPPLPELPPPSDSNPIFSKEYMEYAVQPFDPSFEIQGQKRDYREPDLVPVCYGGVFTIVWGQLTAEDAPVTPHGWKAIAHAMSRENNIEEGHYMERWWAELFAWSSYASSINNSKPRKTGEFLSEEEQSILFKYKYHHIGSTDPFAGTLWTDAMMMIQNEIIDPDDKAPEVADTIKTNKISYHRVKRKKKKPTESQKQ